MEGIGYFGCGMVGVEEKVGGLPTEMEFATEVEICGGWEKSGREL